jgi:hypothetical protein
MLIEPLVGNGRLASTSVFRFSDRVYGALFNNRLFQLVVQGMCINKPLPMQWIHMSHYEYIHIRDTYIIYKALIRSVMTYACPARELAADTHLLKLQHMQNKVFHTNENFPRRTPVND